jgi:hypothetical protein
MEKIMLNIPKHIQEASGKQYEHLLFNSSRAKTGAVISMNWSQFIYSMQMACHETIDDKLKAKLFSPWSPKPNAVGRTKDCAESTALLVFDLDKVDTLDVQEVSDWCTPYTNFVHTTFSHSENGKGCFRVYIPLEESIDINLYPQIHAQVLNQIPEIKKRIDSSSADIARCFFMPSCPPKTKDLSGYAINFMGKHAPIIMTNQSVINPIPAANLPTFISPPSASEGSRNRDLASYAGRAYAKGLSPQEFIDEAIRWGSACQPPMEIEEIRSVVHSMWQTHQRNNPASTNKRPNSGKYLRTAEELKNDPPLEWVVRGVLPSNGIGAIYGAPSSGKTFLALDLAFSVAMGESWFMNPALQKPVAYIALEGSHGIRQRIQAWEKANSATAPKNLLFVTNTVSIEDEGSWQDLTNEIEQALGRGAIVFIDTLNRASPTADENASASMGKIIDSAKKMSDQINGFVMFVHHAGKDASRGLRGHSFLLAALDTVIKVTTISNQRVWSIEKSKDSEIGVCRAFELETIDLDTQDSWGITHTSCVVSQGLLKPLVKPIKGKNQQSIMQLINKMLSLEPTNTIALEFLTHEAAQILDIRNSKRGKERAKAAINSLIASGHLILTDGYITTN